MSSLTQYIKETQGEFKHVNWPSREQSIAFTILVIAITLITAFLLFGFDTIFITLLQKFII